MKYLLLLAFLLLPLGAQKNEFDKLLEKEIKKMEAQLATSNLSKDHEKAYRAMIDKLKNGEGVLRQYTPEDSWNLVDIQTLPETGSKSSSRKSVNRWDDELTEVFQSKIFASAEGISARTTKTSKKENKPDEIAKSGYDISITPPPKSIKPGNLYDLTARVSSFSDGNTRAAFGAPGRSHPTFRFFGAPGSNMDPERTLKTIVHYEEDGTRARKNQYGITRTVSKEPGKLVTEKSVRFSFPKFNPPQYVRIGVAVGSLDSIRVVYVYKYNGKPLPRLALEALDANPKYHGGTLPPEFKALQLANSNVPRIGTTADGVSQLIIRAELPSPALATFKIESEEDGTIQPLLGGKTIYHEEKHLAFALYTPPKLFTPDQKPPTATFDPEHAPKQRLEDILEYREIAVQVTVTGSPKKSSLRLKLARPPVVLVHGLGANPHDCWVMTKPTGTSMVALLEKAGFLPFTVNYQETNGVPGTEQSSSFADNFRAVWDRADAFNRVLPYHGWLYEKKPLPIYSEYQKSKPNRIGGIKHALEHYRENLKLAVTRADVIGHSMGGILARCYSSKSYNPTYKRAENFHQGDINRIITLNTPHHGSELAHVYDALTKAWVGGESWIKWGKRMGPTILGHYYGVKTPAITDLTAPLTAPLTGKESGNSALAKIQANTGVPAFAIATTVDHNQLGSSEYDHVLKYRHLYGSIGIAFFYNRPLLDDFIRTRFNQWSDAPDDLRKGPVAASGTLVSPEDKVSLEAYMRTIHNNIDDNAIYWASRRGEEYRKQLIKQLEQTTIIPFGFLDNDRSEEIKRDDFTVVEQALGVASDFFIGGNLLKLRDPGSDQDVPSSAIGLIRSMIFHNDPKNDGAVRVVSQLGDLPESATAIFGDQDGGIMHSYSTWHYRVQREVIHLLKWQNARFHPAGFPKAGVLTSRHLPSTNLSKDTTTGEHAIEWAGVVPAHAHAYARVADEHRAVILVRPVNRDSTVLIEQDNATKAMAVKGKSSNWGPQKGFIPVEQRFSKLWQVHKKNPGVRAEKIIEYDEITQEVLQEPHPENKGRKYVKEAGLIKDGFEVLCIPAPPLPGGGNPAPAATEPDAEEAIVLKKDRDYFDWKRNPRKLTPDQIKSLVPLNVLAVDQDGPVKYVTADYDLLAIGRYEASIVNTPDTFKHGPTKAVKDAKFDDLMGFVSPPQKKIINDLNLFVERTGYDGGSVTHHGPEVQYYKSPYVDYPILVCDPGEPEVKDDQSVFIIHQGPPGFRDIHLKRYFARQIRKGYRLWPNPDSKGWLWEDYRKFDLSTGYDPTDSPDLLPYVAEQTDPRLENGDEVEVAPEASAQFHLSKALNGHLESQIELAYHYLDGHGVSQNPAKFREWIKRAADSGSVDALAAYGEDLLIGHGGAPDPPKAIELIQKAIETEDHAHALYLMAFAHRNGLGVNKDADKSRAYLVRASNKGLPDAQADLADIYLNTDKAKARELYRKAAEQGSGTAHASLGIFHYNGWLEPADRKKALPHFEKAVQLEDDRVAHTYLGFMYLDGTGGIPADHPKAVGHLQKAAHAGERAAQVEFARCLRDGIGTKGDPVEAQVWYQIAVFSGENTILDEINAHQKTLTPRQRQEVEARYGQIIGK